MKKTPHTESEMVKAVKELESGANAKTVELPIYRNSTE